jgi:hypothetical protein
MPAREWHDKDKSGKWMIEHHGDAILRLVGARDILRWRPVQAEVVQPGRLPDGLLEVQMAGQPRVSYFLLELQTYPAPDLGEDLLKAQLLVFCDRGVVPETLVVVLHPKGQLRTPTHCERSSALDWGRLHAAWRVVELWTLAAEDLLAANDVGLIPWVPLTQYAGPPEVLVQQCRQRIDQYAKPEEHDNLLAVTQVMTRLRYNDPQLLTLLGGSRVMIESPLIQEMMAKKEAETMHKAIVAVLEERFGPVPEDITAALTLVVDEDRLRGLVRQAARCADLNAFRASLVS